MEQSKGKKKSSSILSFNNYTDSILHPSLNPSPYSAAFLINKLSEPLTWVHYYI